MVVVGVLVADTDDAKLHRRSRLLPSVCPPFERDLNGHIDYLPCEIAYDLLKTASWQGNGAGAPFPSLPHNQRIRVRLQPSHEETAVLFYQRKTAETVESEVEQQQPASQPAPRAELAVLVGAFVGKLELFDRLHRRVMHEVKLRVGLIRVSRWKLAEEPMQPEARCLRYVRLETGK